MKQNCLVCFVLILVAVTGCISQKTNIIKKGPAMLSRQQDQVFEKTIPEGTGSKTVNCKYLLFLPEDYGKKEQLWPMILFLHGMGERGSNLEKVKTHGPPSIVEKQNNFPFIVVSPQCPQNQMWSDNIDMLINLIDDIAGRYDVDTDRIYLTGLSMGGYGTWSLAAEYPGRFAAIVPICGGGPTEKACNLKNVPIWAFHGALDNLVPVNESQVMVQAVNACGGNARLTVYPDVSHPSWVPAYNNNELYDWLLTHRRSNTKK